MKGFLRSVLAAAVAVGLAGCGASGKPSESDAKQQIKRGFENCDVISVGSFEKTNGVAQRDGSYTLYVKFTLKGSPIRKNQNLIKELAQRHEELKAFKADYNAQIMKMKNEYDALNKQRDDKQRASTEEVDVAYESRRTVELARAMEELFYKNQSTIYEYERYANFFAAESRGSFRDEYEANVWEVCKLPQVRSMFFMNLANKMFGQTEMFTKKAEAEFTATLNMIRTDNGWVLPEFIKR
ncbi:hypothetical protein [Variovorax terrae]|uniref:Lipoprotein n=1 Tax=Variovorax terrae TaxID=2923278 RepID=A0A9X1W0A4_9BURK|nr:hypothetical protein [Variovorax terrae]MCJ0766194.1 hypothetical protein [Variovorax terrae]